MPQFSTAWIFSREAQEPIHPHLNITKREFLVLVTAGLVVFRFCPEQLKIYRDILAIICSIYLSSLWYDFSADIPPWLLRIAGIVQQSSGTSPEAQPWDNWWRDIRKAGSERTKHWRYQLQHVASRLIAAIRIWMDYLVRWAFSFADPQLRRGIIPPPNPLSFLLNMEPC